MSDTVLDRSPLSDADVLILNRESRCPCLLLLDTSTSMAGEPIEALNEGLGLLATSLKNDPIARNRVELAIVTFGPVQVVQDFVIADMFEPPMLEANGDTPLGQAVIAGLDLIEERKRIYKSGGLVYYRPWLWVMSDGAATDDLAQAAQRASDAETNRRAAIWAVGVGDEFVADELQQISPMRPPLPLRGLAFREMFVWLSRSRSQRSQSYNTSDVPADQHQQVPLQDVRPWATTP